jgi:hypothetical protein
VFIKRELAKVENNPNCYPVPDVMKEEMFSDSNGSLNKFVADFKNNKKENRSRGRPPVWLNINSYEQRNDLVNNGQIYVDDYKDFERRDKKPITTKAALKEKKKTRAENILFTKEVKANISDLKCKRKGLNRKCKREKKNK